MKQTIYSRCTLLMAFSFFLTSLSAKDIYLSSTGIDTNDGLTSGTSVASFSRAYAVAVTGDNIKVLGIIDFSIDPANTSSPKAGIAIAKNLTVQGSSQLTDGFDGKNLTRFFTLSSNSYTLTLKNLTLKNGKCTAALGGGAIKLTGGSVVGENLLFDSNSALFPDNTGVGSVIFTDGYSGLSFKNCVFSNNTSDKAGVIYIANTNGANVGTRFEGCAFISNKGGSYTTSGVAIYYSTASANCSLSFINSTIAKNQTLAAVNGGTIQLQGSPSSTTVNITNCTITENSTAGARGNCSGIRIASGYAGIVNISNSIIEGNTTTNGYDDINIGTATPSTSTLMIHNSIIGRYSGTPLPAGCYPNPNMAFLTPTALSAALGTFNSTYNCYPLLSTSPAINYGASIYLTSLTPSITTDQLGYIRSFTNNSCEVGAIELPKISVSTTASLPTAMNPIPVTVSFSKSVAGFTIDDLVVGNGTASNFAGSDSTYTFDVTPSVQQGTITVDIASAVATDILGNPNVTANQFSMVYDRTTELISIKNSSIIYSENDAIIIKESAGKQALVYSLAGQKVKTIQLTSNCVRIPILKGSYVVSIENQKLKIIVR